jgi:hypothetical protein
MRLLALPVVVVPALAAACVVEPTGEEEVLDGQALLAGKSDGDDHLHVQFPPVTLVPGVPLDGWRLNHSIVTADVDLTGLFSVDVQIRVPADFFVDVGTFLLYDLPAGAQLTLDTDTSRWGGETLHVYVRRLPGNGEGRAEGIHFPPGNSASFTIDPTAEPIPDEVGVVVPGTSHYIVTLMPAQLRPGSDHVMLDLRASLR